MRTEVQVSFVFLFFFFSICISCFSFVEKENSFKSFEEEIHVLNRVLHTSVVPWFCDEMFIYFSLGIESMTLLITWNYANPMGFLCLFIWKQVMHLQCSATWCEWLLIITHLDLELFFFFIFSFTSSWKNKFWICFFFPSLLEVIYFSSHWIQYLSSSYFSSLRNVIELNI